MTAWWSYWSQVKVVGIYHPALSNPTVVLFLARATTMNFFRVPLNLIVVGILLQNLPMKVIFQCCVAFLFLAALAQHWLYRCLQYTLPTLSCD